MSESTRTSRAPAEKRLTYQQWKRRKMLRLARNWGLFLAGCAAVVALLTGGILWLLPKVHGLLAGPKVFAASVYDGTDYVFNAADARLTLVNAKEADCALLEKCGATLVFAPSVEEVYPEPDTRQFSYAPLDTVMEGKYRPGHFNGVCQIVSKLFLMVEPHRAYFGEKDFQQLAIIREMVRKYPFNIQIVGCPIVREEDGLALSSRNARLTAEQRKEALQISKALFASVDFSKSRVLLETKQFVEDCIRRAPGLELEYFEIVDGNTLQPVKAWDESNYIVGCITVYCGEVRLIDNIKYKG